MIGAKAALHIADVTKPDEVKALVEATVKRFGRLDFLVNNAAVRYETAFSAHEVTKNGGSVLAIVLDGAFLCAQAALPHMIKAGGGTIVNIGGQTGHKGAAERAHVITAKAGLAGMTKALAMDLAPHKITVNCVVPGTIDSQRGLPGVPDRPAHRLTRAADRPARRARGDRRDGAHAVRAGRALHHRAVDPLNGGGYHAVSISPVMQRLSAYIAQASEKALPPAVLEKTKHHVLDTIAAMVSGSRLLPGPQGHLLRRRRWAARRSRASSAAACSPPPPTRRSPTACRAHADETDDSHAPSLTHPGCGIVPAALAVAEKEGSSGEALLRAVALGYDICARLTMSLNAYRVPRGRAFDPQLRPDVRRCRRRGVACSV